MPRRCTICSHKNIEEINKELVNGKPFRDIAGQFNISKSALERHKAKHLPGDLIKSKRIEEVVQADNIVERLINLTNETMQIYNEVKKIKDYDLALKAIARAEKQAELQAKLLGELQQEGAVNLIMAPEWIELRQVILRAVEPFPEAGEAIVEAVGRIDKDVSK